MELDYINTPADYAAQFKATQPAAMAALAFRHHTWIGYWCVMAGLGIYVSFLAELVFMAAVFFAMLLNFLFRALPYSRVFDAAPVFGGTRRIHLSVSDEGLRELIEEKIESFVPWDG